VARWERYEQVSRSLETARVTTVATVRRLRVNGYRSIGKRVEIVFPEKVPVVLVGENNSGKSNIVKALQLPLGQFWPGSHEPEDFEFFGRDRETVISIEVEFARDDPLGSRFDRVTWRYNSKNDTPVSFSGRLLDGKTKYVSNADRDTCMCVVLEAERNLRYQLSYSSKYTFLSRLMHRFHQRMTERVDIKQELEILFAKTKKEFERVPEFAAFKKELRKQLGKLVASMTHRLEVDFQAYNPANFFHALELHAMEGDEPRALEEMGTGEQQVLALAFAYAFAKAFHEGVLLVIEEPESHLHPLAQEWLAKKLRDMASGGLQILVTTHSAHFIDLMSLEGLVLVGKDADGTWATQKTCEEFVGYCEETGVSHGRVTVGNILPFYRANATREILEGFLSKAVVLVEGVTESLALPIYFEKAALDVAHAGVAVIPVQGKGNLAKWKRLFEFYGIPCFVIFDNDAQNDEQGTKRKDALLSLGIADDDAEELITTTDWLVYDRFAIFGSDFEKVLQAHFPSYKKLEAQARRAGVDTKPFVARWVAERIEDEGSEGREKMVEIAIKIFGLLYPGS
jgi:putative ATP-dependent endonuclease of the OLD family